MASEDRQQLFSRILLGAVVLVLAGGMLLYLVPTMPGTGPASPDVVARVGEETVTVSEVRQQLADIQQRSQIPRQMESLYVRQILDQLIFEKELEYEAKRLGIR